MALSATVVFEIRPAGANADDANGGGFKAGASGTDYSFTGLEHFDITDLVTDGATLTVMCSAALHSASGFTAADVGNIVHVVTSDSDGYAYVERFEILSVAGGKATVDRAWASANNSASATKAVAILGGALATPGGLGFIFAQTTTVASAQAVAGMKAYMLHGTYTLSNVAANVTGGPLDLATSSMVRKGFYLKGYDDAYGRDSFLGTPPLIDCGVITPTIAKVVLLQGDFGAKKEQVIAFVEVDGQGLLTTGIVGAQSAYASAICCYVHDCDLSGNAGFVNLKAIRCRASDCAGDGFYACHTVGCLSNNNGGKGFGSGSAQFYFNSVAYKNGGMGFQSYSSVLSGCVAYDNGLDGFYDDSSNVFVNCVGYLNDRYEFNTIGGDVLINCATRVGASGRTHGTPNCDVGPITLTADPFTNAAALDFSLNNTAGGGALLRAAGISPYGQTGFIDIGAVQADGKAVQLLIDQAAVGAVADDITTNVSGLLGTVDGTLDMDLYRLLTDYTDPGEANVVVGNDYTYAGESRTAAYPTTATSKAAQLQDDKDAVTAGKASIKDNATILTIDGTYDFTAAIAAAYAGGEFDQHSTDAAFLETNKAEIAATGAAILGEFGVTGTFTHTAAYVAIAGLPNVKYVYNAIDRGDGATGTLRASNLHTGAGSPGVDLAATDLKSGVTVDDVAGSYAGGGGGVIVIDD
jgi:hypothetical protein